MNCRGNAEASAAHGDDTQQPPRLVDDHFAATEKLPASDTMT
jgi:hypothetical protein